MQLYQFEKIYSQMEKEFGKIRKSDEETYSMLLLPMESNALKIHRKIPASNSRRMKEAIALVLFDIKSRCTGESFDTGNFRNEDNERLETALLMAFDPYTNSEIKELLISRGRQHELDLKKMQQYYKIPVMCLLRIKASIDTWEKNAGTNGYFDFIEGYMGTSITGDEMKYSVMMQDLYYLSYSRRLNRVCSNIQQHSV